MLLERELEERRRAVEEGMMGLLEQDLGFARDRVGEDD